MNTTMPIIMNAEAGADLPSPNVEALTPEQKIYRQAKPRFAATQ
jgi:hypothetical protein